MFVKLTEPPRKPVDCERLPTLFEDHERIRINGMEYVIHERRLEEGVIGILGVGIRHADSETVYAVAVTSDGLSHCSCESFQFVAGRESRPCKHLAALDQLGFLTFPESTHERSRACPDATESASPATTPAA